MLRFNLAELRRRGYSEEDYSDLKLVTAGETIFQIIKLFTNRDFDLRLNPLNLDGSGTEELYLPIPIISITSITEGEDDPLTEDDYIVYNRDLPDDRQKPYIIKVNGTFPEGNQNIEVQGVFGYVDGNLPPAPLLEAANRILYLMFQPLLEDGDGIEIPQNPSEIKKETTDRWSYEKYNRETIGCLFDNITTALLMKYSRGNDLIFGDYI